jgi:hypothetical protein
MEAWDVRKPLMKPSALPPFPISVTSTIPAEDTFPHHSLWNESADPSAKSWTNSGSGGSN